MKKTTLLLITFLVLQIDGFAKNPIIPNKGANDTHIRIIDGKAYLAASHDKSIDNKKFIMEDWWLWSSVDLVNWKLESLAEIDNNDYLIFPNIKGLEQKTKIEINITNVKKSTIEILDESPSGQLIASYKLNKSGKEGIYSFDFPSQRSTHDLCFVFKGKGDDLVHLDWLSFQQ